MAVTLGDAAGIGPEIIVKAFRDAPAQMQGCVVIGDEAVLLGPAPSRVRLAHIIRRHVDPLSVANRFAKSRPPGSSVCRKVLNKSNSGHHGWSGPPLPRQIRP